MTLTKGMATFLYVAGITIMLMLSVCMVQADYHVGFVISEFSHPSNRLANNTCCDPTCSECGVTLRFCFRDSGHSQSDTESPCTVFQLNRNYATFFSVFGTDHNPTEGPYPGDFQIYVRVSHSQDHSKSVFDPPYTDPLIDDIFIEVSAPAVTYDNRNSPDTRVYDVVGVYGKATMQIRVNVHCAEGYSGPDCNEEGPGGLIEDPEENENSVVPIAVGSTIGGVVVIVLVVIAIAVAVALKKSKYRVWKPKYKWHPATTQSETNLYADAIENPSYNSSS